MTNNKEKYVMPNTDNITESFSSINDEQGNDFQTAHMMNKIKKIKKKKHNQNISGVEEFDVLTNTDVPNKEQVNDTNPQTTHKPHTNILSMQYWKQLFFGKTVEGATNYFTNDEYEGGDNLKEPNSKPLNIRQKIIRAINTIYDTVNAINHKIASKTLNSISKNTATDEDIKIARNQIALLESAIVSIWMVYNWYFLMFYAKPNDIKVMEFSREKLAEWANNNELVSVIIYLFEFAIWFPEKLDHFLLQTFPSYTSWLLNGTCQFLFIYVICVILTKNFAITFKNFFIDLLTDATGNFLINIMFAIVLILFFVSMFTIKFVGEFSHDTKEVISVLGSFMNPIGSFFKWFLRFLITIIVSVPMGAVICGLYFITYSLFGVYIYGGIKWGWSSSRLDIDEYIRNAHAGFQEEDMCNNGGFMNFILSILKIIFNVMQYVKEHILKLAFLVIFFQSTVTMFNNLSITMQNRHIFIFFNILITIALTVIVGVSIVEYNRLLNVQSSPTISTESTTPSTNIDFTKVFKEAVRNNTVAQPEVFLTTNHNIETSMK